MIIDIYFITPAEMLGFFFTYFNFEYENKNN